MTTAPIDQPLTKFLTDVTELVAERYELRSRVTATLQHLVVCGDTTVDGLIAHVRDILTNGCPATDQHQDRLAAVLAIVAEMEHDIPEDNGNSALHHFARGLRAAATGGCTRCQSYTTECRCTELFGPDPLMGG